MLRNGKINLYTGTQPTSPDDAATGTLLCTLSLNGGANGFEFGSASAGAISKPSGETWEGTNVATGTIGYGRIYEEGDSPGSSSTTFARYDFSVGTSGQDVNMTSTTATSGAKTTLSAATLTVQATA